MLSFLQDTEISLSEYSHVSTPTIEKLSAGQIWITIDLKDNLKGLIRYVYIIISLIVLDLHTFRQYLCPFCS